MYSLSVLAAIICFHSYCLWFAWFVLVVLLCLPVLSLLLSLPAMYRAKLDTSVFQHVSMNTNIRLHLTCGKAPTPPWRCKLLVQRPLSGEKQVLRAGDAFPTLHAGALHCTVQKLKVYDYLGQFCRTLRRHPPYTVYVMPYPVASRPPVRKPDSALAWKPKWGGGLSENHELRLYRPGDNVQQIHWKLSAKTGKLIFRQPMEPVRGQFLLRLDLSGSHQELDRKLGKLLWLGQYLLKENMDFRINALTGSGAQVWPVTDKVSFHAAFDALLSAPSTLEKIPAILPDGNEWQYYIGGDGNET